MNTENTEKKNTEPPKPPKEEFETFWKAWPRHHRKTNKAKSLKKYLSLSVDPDIIMTALEALKKSHDWTKNNGKYIPAPLVWLSNGGYEVDVETLHAKPGLQQIQNGRKVTNLKLGNVTRI